MAQSKARPSAIDVFRSDPAAGGTVIRRFRTNRGISGEQLAREAGIARPYLVQIEQGARTPSEETLGRLGTALRVPDAALKAEFALVRQELAMRLALANLLHRAKDRIDAASELFALTREAQGKLWPFLVGLAQEGAASAPSKGSQGDTASLLNALMERASLLPARDLQVLIACSDQLLAAAQ